MVMAGVLQENHGASVVQGTSPCYQACDPNQSRQAAN